MIVVPKKGTAFSTNTKDGLWSSDIVKLNSNWFYSWGTTFPSDPTPNNIPFVPMFWGSGSLTTQNLNYVIQQAKAGKVSYILGFNEPDRTDQANLTVSQALALWPQLESLNIPLGSPAVSYPSAQWLSDFMDSTIAQKKRVDFICLHMYVGTDDVNFMAQLQTIYNKYHLPIWITEFATSDFGASTIAANHYTPSQALGFMQRLLPQLESSSFVARYSWFSGDTTDPALWPSALVDASGNLTPLGTYYSTFKP